MRYAQIDDFDVANGENVGVSIFLQGCSVHCKNCFNKSTWDFNSGLEWTDKETESLFMILNKPYITRLTLLGGEPLDQAKDLLQLLKEIRNKYPNLNIWIYSGRTLEENLELDKRVSTNYRRECLELCDVLVDGRYVDELKDLTLAFRGSSNQRLIDLKKIFNKGKQQEVQYRFKHSKKMNN